MSIPTGFYSNISSSYLDVGNIFFDLSNNQTTKGNKIYTGIQSITNTTVSTSISTGALIVSGYDGLIFSSSFLQEEEKDDI